ncbi:hypothetical protein T484DRAFT_1752625 [Baffinella frigidus]|nr:hypothetical protein T484DRAFT_1752625 [Cryptophyta sp. CCMP2293]
MTIQSESVGAGIESVTLACSAVVSREDSFNKLLRRASCADSTNSTAITRRTSAVSVGRPGSPFASDIHRLLYAPLPSKSTNLPESPSSISGSVRQWQQGQSARRQAATRPLAEKSTVSFYFSEELRLQHTGSRGDSTTRRGPGRQE